MYSVNGANYARYSGPLDIPANAKVSAFVTGDSYLYYSSPAVEGTYTAKPPVTLTAPMISSSHSQFLWSTAETITVSLENPNDSKISSLSYQVDGGGWNPYTGPIQLAINDHESGATISARALPLTVDYKISPESSLLLEGPPPPIQLQAPEIIPSASSFIPDSVESITITLRNPNSKGSELDYRLNGGAWEAYSNPVSVGMSDYATGLTVEARARAISRAYLTSEVSSTSLGLTPVQLRSPAVNLTAPNFMAGSVEKITVTLTNPNRRDSALDYRVNGGTWQAYTGAFTVTRAAYATGLAVEARAIATSVLYLDSDVSSSEVGLTPVQLSAPGVATSAQNFMAGSVESISVTLTNPNATGSALDYRLAGGSWQAYSSAFSITRASYPTGLTVEGRARATEPAYSDSETASSTIGLTPVQLQTPSISFSAPNFVANTEETISVTLTNPNSTGSALDYRLDGGSWQAYSATFNVTRASYPTGVTVEARARSTAPAYTDSSSASATIGLTPVQLQNPSIGLSVVNFMAGSVESITVTLRNPNATGSALDYRLAGGSWQAYSSAFSVTRAAYATGLTIEARARSTAPAYSDSDVASSTVGLTAVKLQNPTIARSASNFVAGTVETITVTLSNPNATGSALDYRLAGGSWQAYSSPFSVTRAIYASGVTVEARARSTSPAYTDSDNASSAIGLTPVKLQAPTVSNSASNFIAGSVETITVTLNNPNATGSALDYRLNAGSWQAYSSAFSVTRDTYATGLTLEARARSTSPAYTDSDNASSTIGLTPVQLQAPSIGLSSSASGKGNNGNGNNVDGVDSSNPGNGKKQDTDPLVDDEIRSANFIAGSVETITVTLMNPNTTGSALDYRLNGGSWLAYSSAFSVTLDTYPTGVTVEARARSTAPAYTNSGIASANVGVNSVQLQNPVITPSASNFMAGSVETITVSVTNSNSSSGSALDYRLNGGDWQAYSSAFSVTRSAYATGLTIEARARSTAAAYTDSGNASSTIGLTPVQLQNPGISKNASNFMAGSVETITVTLTNPNASGAALDYRLNGGSWQAYSSAFSLSRAGYPSGLTLEACARSTSGAYTDSEIVSSTVGLTPVQLQAPQIGTSASNFATGSVESITVTLTNPNATGSALDYCLNGGSWQAYSSAFSVTRASYPSGLTIGARARSTSAAYTDSGSASATVGLTPVQLQNPQIATSASNFVAGSVDDITVTITNPNEEGSTLDYRLAGGSWQAYSGAFSVTRATYASGLTLDARARATDAAYTSSGNASYSIGLTPVQLQTPEITKSAPNFYASLVETISITVSNPNATGSALDYRLNGGSWVPYSSTFNVTRASYPNGLTVEARARSTAAAYSDSANASTSIGLGTVQLQTPAISPSAPNFMADSVESITVTVTSPNPSSGSYLQYNLNGSTWKTYSSPFSLSRSTYPSGLTVNARAKASNAAYSNSASATCVIGLTPAQLSAPTISTSASNFMAGSVESISVSVSNPNSTGSALDYRINGGSWVAYSNAFNVTRSSYATGLLVEARARSTASAYSNSDNASKTIGLTPVQLQAPVIRLNTPNFVIGSVESVSVTLTNLNASATGSVLDYRLNGGSWLTYSSTFTVTRANYPSGVTVDARARATKAAYSNSEVASISVAVKNSNAQKVTLTFSTLGSSAGYLNEANIFINGDMYYLGNSDMGSGYTTNVDVYLDPTMSNVFDLTIDTYTRSGSTFTSGPLRGMDTTNGSEFTLISAGSSFAGRASTAAKIKDLSSSSMIDMIVGYEDMIIAGGTPDYDYNDMMFELKASQYLNFVFGGYTR